MTHMQENTLRSYTSIRHDVLGLIQNSPRRVLDVGCSNGALSAEIKKRFSNVYVVGIEYDEILAKEASQRLDRVITADLDIPKEREFTDEGFDLFIFADVLEHTKFPKFVLNDLLNLAAPDAKIILSLPNVQHWTALYELLSGSWPERDRGLFDRTHLRWFTKKSIVSLALDCDLSIVSIERNFRILDRPGGRINRLSKYAACLPFKNFLTYQYLVVLKLSADRPGSVL